MGEAKAWWFRHVKTADYAAEIMAGLNRWTASDQWNAPTRRAIHKAITFLQKHRYREHPEPQRAQSRRELEDQKLAAYGAAMDAQVMRRNGGGQ
jgi:hypothetical protein